MVAALDGPILIDEWQFVPEVLGAVKRAVDAMALPSRIGRDLTGRFGCDAYAAEELVAELTAAASGEFEALDAGPAKPVPLSIVISSLMIQRL